VPYILHPLSHARRVKHSQIRALHQGLDLCEEDKSTTERYAGRVKSYLTDVLFPKLLHKRESMNRVGQNHIYTVYIRYFRQGNH
jgi:hypothetical protein